MNINWLTSVSNSKKGQETMDFMIRNVEGNKNGMRNLNNDINNQMKFTIGHKNLLVLSK
jgi:hypothetical protein